MKGLPPALRRKKRYIVFEIVRMDNNTNTISAKDLMREIWYTVITLYGELYGNVGLKLEYFDGNKAIIKCSRDRLSNVITALTLISKINNVKVVIKTLGVSGTIKGCRKYFK